MTRAIVIAAMIFTLGALACSGAPGPSTATLPPPDDLPPIPRYIATVATNHFARGNPLERAEADADAIERAFIERLQFEAPDALRLRADDATTENIRDLIADSGPLHELPEESMLVLYIALHGDTTGCETHHRCGRLWTRDAGKPSEAIEVGDLLEQLAHRGPRHVIVLLDTCYGGLALRASVKPLDYRTLVDKNGKPLPLTRPGQRKSRKVLTAAGPLQLADDGSGNRPGRFAEVLLDALDGDADLVADGRLVFTELALYVQAEVRRRSAAGQEPEFGGFLDDGRGAPVLGGLRLPVVEAGATDTLLTEAHRSIDRAEYRAAQRHIARLMQARRQRALTARQTLQGALRLADAGRGEDAVALLGAQAKQQQATLGADHPAVAVTHQLRAALARDAALPAQQVERIEDEAATASRAASRAAQTSVGRAITADALGGMAATSDDPALAADLAADGRAAAGPDTALVGALAANEAISAAAAGETERAEAARAVAAAPGASTVPERPETIDSLLPATRYRPAMVPIQPGEFIMGTEGMGWSQRPVRVRLTRGFLIAETEVSQEQYTALVGANPSASRGRRADRDRPVEQVSWFDAVKYCNALSAKEGLETAYAVDGASVTWSRDAVGYRLPTEAEWEYTARAGTTGPRYGELDIVASPDGTSERETLPVKAKRPNEWGLYGMLGNVWEWTWDWRYRGWAQSPDSFLRVDPAGPASGDRRVVRGGPFAIGARRIRAAGRDGRKPDYRYGLLGFRPVRFAGPFPGEP